MLLSNGYAINRQKSIGNTCVTLVYLMTSRVGLLPNLVLALLTLRQPFRLWLNRISRTPS
eukprot:7127343-Prorocentrum_lima.AAC.1